MDVTVVMDRSTTIRSALADTQRTLLISMGLVILVTLLFLRDLRATLVPSVAVPVSIIGTFAAMYLLGYSLDNLSLMALIVATGFVVDDAIVVLENIARHVEDGMSRLDAALLGAREVGFTVLSMSVSLVAVFLPILLMGGIVGRLFREFAVTLSLAIVVSMVISLTTTPMMCAMFLRPEPPRPVVRGRSLFERVQDGYARSLHWALDHSLLIVVVLIATVAMNVWLVEIIPKGFFPEQDTGRMIGSLQADQSISFQLMSKKLAQMMQIIRSDPSVQDVVGSTGAGGGGGASQTNTGTLYISLKPLSQRPGILAVMARLRRRLGAVPGGRLFLQAIQDIRVGGRSSNAQYQYTLLGDSTAEVYEWAPKLLAALEKDNTFTDVSSDQQQKGMETNVVIDRDTASRLGLTLYQIDNTLYDAFGQRSVSTIYNALNQYHVVMEVAPRFWQRPETLKQIWISTSGGQPSGSSSTQLSAGSVVTGTATGVTTASVAAVAPVSLSLSSAAASAGNSGTAIGNNAVSLALTSNSAARPASTSTSSSASTAANNAVRTAAQSAIATTGSSTASTGAAVATSVETMVPLSAVAHWGPGNTPLAVNHQSQFVATTISFNLPAGKSLSDASAAIDKAIQDIHMPASVIGRFAGTALVYQQSLGNELILVIAALAAIYIVLGILYESFIHPITILSTLPSAGVGAVLALILFGIPFTLIAVIGVILLIGIVKKNAILMIDFALHAEREGGMETEEAIFQAAVMRFRPIMMTTIAAMLGALPLCFSFGEGSELRQPLGISIVGGLLVSQVLTLYTTPVVYLYLDRLRPRRSSRARRALS
jgi:multidrug efflux pump subunit AcrB